MHAAERELLATAAEIDAALAEEQQMEAPDGNDLSIKAEEDLGKVIACCMHTNQMQALSPASSVCTLLT